MDILELDRGKHFDPAVIDAFGKVARELYDRYAGHESADLKDELAAVVEKYFSVAWKRLTMEKGRKERATGGSQQCPATTGRSSVLISATRSSRCCTMIVTVPQQNHL